MKISDRTQIFLNALRVTAFTLLVSVGVTTLSSCTVTYKQRRPAPPPPPEVVYVDPDPYPDDFPELDPYGRWVHVANAGWAWQPAVRSEWRPYHHGHWTWTNHDWTWMSYEPFGWVVYHYGNWAMDSQLGWVWFPGYEWQPHRVSWVVYQDHIAWAPMPYTGYSVGDPWTVNHVWNVCHVKDFRRPYVGDYHVTHFRPKVYNKRYIITRAPGTEYIYHYTGRRVVKVHIKTHPDNKKGIKRIALPPEEYDRVQRHRKRAHEEVVVKKGKGHNEGPTPMLPPNHDPKIAGGGPNIMSEPDRPGNKDKKDDPKMERQRPDNKDKKDDPKMERQRPDNKDKKDDPKMERQRPDNKDKKDDPKMERQHPDNKGKKDDSKSDHEAKEDKGKKDDPKSKRQEPDKKGKKDDSKSEDDAKDNKGKKDDSKSEDDAKDNKGKKGDSKKDDEKSDKDEPKSKKNDKDSDDKDDDSESDGEKDDSEDEKDKKGKGKGKK